jgi:gas vesicle protein
MTALQTEGHEMKMPLSSFLVCAFIGLIAVSETAKLIAPEAMEKAHAETEHKRCVDSAQSIIDDMTQLIPQYWNQGRTDMATFASQKQDKAKADLAACK